MELYIPDLVFDARDLHERGEKSSSAFHSLDTSRS